MISKEDILKKLSQEEIAKFYFPYHISLKKQYKNPFRSDKHPGCTFKYSKSGVFYFIDWAVNKNYDCFNIAQESLKIDNFQKLLQRISKDFNLNLMPNSLSIPKEKMNITNEQPKKSFVYKSEPKSYQCEEKEFSFTELAWWKNQGFTKQDLINFRISSVKRFCINDYILESSIYNPIFKYSFDNNQYQIYCPNNDVRFYSIMESYYLMGFDDLPIFGKDVIITSSYKDVCQLIKCKFAAIAPVGESTGIKREDLVRLFKRFDKVYVNFNNDKVGIQAAEKLLKDFSDFPLIAVFTNNGKDPTEVVKTESREHLIKQFLDYGIRQI